MPKPLELSAEIMTPPPVPQAAQMPPSSPVRIARPSKSERDEPKVPFQVRWPRADVKAAKLAALNLDFSSESEFMLACFHAYMQTRGSKK